MKLKSAGITTFPTLSCFRYIPLPFQAAAILRISRFCLKTGNKSPKPLKITKYGEKHTNCLDDSW